MLTVAEMIGELRAGGLSYVSIGQKLQVSAITVRRWAHGDFDPRYQQGKALEGLHQSVMSEVESTEGAIYVGLQPFEQHTTVISQVSSTPPETK